MSDITPEQVRALKPILERARKDRIAQRPKKDDGTGYAEAKWAFEPLTLASVERHLNGGPALGVGAIKPGESVTMMAVVDLDSHQGETPWHEMVSIGARVADALRDAGMPSTAFRSTGGRGMHLYVVWDAPQDAYSVRQAVYGALATVGLRKGDGGVSRGQAEVFPKQDSVDIGGDGNMFIVPLAGESVGLDLLFGEPIDVGDVQWVSARPVARLERPERVQSASRLVPIATIRSALAAIPNESRADGVDYDTYLVLMFATHDGSGGSEEGVQAGLEFSIRNKDIVEEHGGVEGVERFLRQRLWQYAESGKGVTVGTLFRIAHERSGGTWVPPIDISDFVDQTTGEISDAAVVGHMGVEVLPPLMEVDPRLPVVLGQVDNLAVMREALETGKAIIAACVDIVGMGEVYSSLTEILKTHSELLNALYVEVNAKLKQFGGSITKTEFKKLVRPVIAPTVNERFPLTEFGNTDRMIARYGKSLMYVPETKSWYVWDKDGSNYWRKSSEATDVAYCAKQTVRAISGEVKYHDGSDEERQRFFEFCAASQRAFMVQNMVYLASIDHNIVVPVGELDKHSHLLGVANGVVDLRTGELLPADRSMRITLNTNIDYDPLAVCPVFDQTLSEVFYGDTEMAEYIMRTFGYALLGNPVEDIMFFPFGDGSNGKSTIFSTIKSVFGSYARSADASSFVSDDQKGGSAGGAREDLVRLRGARFVYVNEPDEGAELREGMVKSMTGGEDISARAMYAKESIEIRPTWVAYMPTNHRPVIKGSDHGIWRRMGMIPFERNFDKDATIVKDENREAKLKAEQVGVLAAVVRGCLQYQKRGLAHPAKVLAARDSYRDQMDLLSEWLDERCEINPTARCEMRMLWESWESFARGRGLLNYIRSSTALGRRLDKRFTQVKGTNGVRLRQGIKLKVNDDLFVDAT